MVEITSVESIEHNSIDTLNLNNQQFRLNKINEIKKYFIAEIKRVKKRVEKRELISKRLSKYIASFDYFDKSLIVYQQQVVVFLLHHSQQVLEHL